MTKSIFLLLLSFILLISCDKQGDENLLQPNSNNVNQKIALDIAQSFFKNSNTTSKGINSSKTIDNIIVHKTAKNENAFYVINYREGGFIIISSDNRINPILAFSETNKFSSNPTEIPEGALYWLEEKKKEVQYTIDHKLLQSKDVALLWSKVTNYDKSNTSKLTGRLPADDPNYCPDSQYIVGPLLTTKWNQWGNGFNDLIPYVCPSNPGGKAPTGCVATAMGQIMRYFQKSNTYNWANMPASYGTYDTQLLMKNIGSAVSMQYGCNSSGAYTTDVVPAFINYFNYSNATYGDYNYQTVKQQININKPVYLSGGGHAWVCDGFKEFTSHASDCSSAVTYLMLDMNWGWGSASDGYYAFDNFNPPGYNFNSNRKMVYNVTP